MTPPPPGTNGHHDLNAGTAAPDASDAKFLYIIIGGMITAFLLGIIILVIALASDWNGGNG